jgi:hypothetical protein
MVARSIHYARLFFKKSSVILLESPDKELYLPIIEVLLGNKLLLKKAIGSWKK